MTQDEKQGNDRTMIFCKFLQTSGIPSSGDIGSLEHAALQWIKNIRKNCNNLFASDLNIIRKHGLFNKIFVDQIRQNKVEELEKQMLELSHQLRAIKEGIPSVPVPKITVPKITIKKDVEKSFSENHNRFIAAYKANRKKYRMKLLRAISGNKDGLSKGEMHIVLGGHATGKILQDCISFLENKNLIFMKAVEKRTAKGCKSVVRHWFSVKGNNELETTEKAVVQKQLFDNLPIADNFIINKRPYTYNPECVWAKNVEVFSSRLNEEDLIGAAKIKSIKTGLVRDCGLENYCIYPSGAIKYYLRWRSHDGSFGYAFWRWSTSKDIVEINLKPEFDFGGN
jgi:hypothetical protein